MIPDTNVGGNITTINEQSERLIEVMDRVNRQSKTKIVIARNAGAAAYTMRREHLSPAYTTDWENLPLVR
jgi:DNA polymerase V